MAGIYLHIPFCKQKCHYCNFYSLATVREKEDFLKALLREMEMQSHYAEGEQIESIYWGGGTPSLLSAGEINSLFNQLYKHYPIHPKAEITLEANPEDLSQEFLDQLKKTPVNRLSIGVQSFLDKDLKYLNRIHTAKDAMSALVRARNAGFDEFSIDLIYGIPSLSAKEWKSHLEIVNDINITHFSAYALTVEPRTALEKRIRNKLNAPVKDDLAVEHFNILMDWATDNDWDHYEISNLCKPGHQSKHNTHYWQAKKYLGLGPSAHSFNIRSRQWNVANLKGYIEKINEGIVPFESEELTTDQKFNEYVLLGMRTKWGCDTTCILNQFGSNYASGFQKNILPFVENGQVVRDAGTYTLSRQGKLFADGISAALFVG